MRTTLTIDDDVAAALRRLRQSQGMGLKEAVNEALRLGLALLSSPAAARASHRIEVWDAGRLYLDPASIAGTGELIATWDDDAFAKVAGIRGEAASASD